MIRSARMVVPSFIPLPPRRQRPRPASPPPPPAPPAPVTVVSVRYVDGYTADWTFSAEVTLIGANVPELQINGWDLGWASPSAVVQLSPTVLRADYTGTAGLRVGDAWRIIVQPGNIAQELEIPENGNVSGAQSSN